MQILKKACGAYGTNCYILKSEQGDFVIDPGDGAFDFVKQNTTQVKAILNTHGHFDHVWDNEAVKRHFKAPIYIHQFDEFMLNDPFGMGHEQSKADVLITDENEFEIAGVKFKFLFFPGHTPGCCMIELVGENLAFSGDFLFQGSIGRYDFPYSDANLMKQSLERVASFKDELRLLPGHGKETTLKTEQAHLDFWLRNF
ncbi:MBL fold metallo-hydrolase [Campylobacter sp. MIT 97-5078]|uniref:MBL fold metallo-hydrolase n=1 Tax=Campylobacter sp. MIT 97-5078 TaxID=1548153 RepID=UPI000513EAE3|nr:MBL fold metallo-hydrolase [Campylobacter sp. MIT 97-5078]KGI57021.1 beta-lactamase [Campylobacter sp. MIT 97-5078]TQR28148.1 MBL fold metallo-hydrolase [Campylobacter sp. MIT 97-5078]